MQGHIHKRIHSTADGRKKTTWYVVINLGRGATGRRRQKWHGGFRTRKEAEAARAKLVNEVNTGIYAEPTKITLQEWVTGSWLPTMRSQVKPTTWASYDRMLRLHVLPALGDRPLHKLTSTLLNAMYSELINAGYKKESRGGGLHPKTVRHIHSTLHKVLGDAVDAGLLANNPADRAKPPRPRASTPTEMRFWNAEQLGRFLEHIEGDRLQAAWRLLAMTGMRRGEVLGLRWQDVTWTLVAWPFATPLPPSGTRSESRRPRPTRPGPSTSTRTRSNTSEPISSASRGRWKPGAPAIRTPTWSSGGRTALQSTPSCSANNSRERSAAPVCPGSGYMTCDIRTRPSLCAPGCR
jgi:hypothetical protein